MSFLGAQNSIALGVQGIIAIDTGTGTIAVVTDPYWANVSMLLHGDSPQQFNQDTSTNVFPITANGAVQASTRTPFTGGPSSYGSGYFAPSSGYLTTPNNAAFSFGTSDFTIECWVYLTNALSKTIFDARSADTQTAYGLFTDTNGKPYWYDASGTQLSSTALNTSTWTHIAVVRTSGVLKIFTAGAQTYSAANTNTQNPTGTFSIGKNFSGSAYFDGYISNFRVVNGTAVYTSAFTPPTVQLTAVTNTALLTLQTNVPQNNNQFFDTSTNNFTVTRNGNTTQGSFNPFVSTYPYAVATNGGSAYFDGTGDYLTVPDNAVFNLAANDFTIECWIRFSSISNSPGVAGQSNSANSILSFSLNIQSDGRLITYLQNAAGSYLNGNTSAGSITINTWYHIAFVRDGSTLRQYVNGVQDGTVNATGFTVRDSSDLVAVGAQGLYISGNLPTGYISNFRLVNGTCLYPSGTTFTPPTAPLTAVTNTALLLGMSNGAIYDNTMLNNLETVGNSQISTSTFKYGTGALKFGGTSTDYMPTRKTSAFVLGSSDFTIECWVNFASATANGYFAGDYGGTSSFNFYMWANAGVMISTLNSAGNRNCTSSAGAIVVNTWYHIAFVRDGNTNRQYINGVQNGTVSVTGLTADTNDSPLAIGAVGSVPLAPYFNGYIDDFRFTKGICRYPSGTTFTPPTAAFPNS